MAIARTKHQFIVWHNFPTVPAVTNVDFLSFHEQLVTVVLAASWQYMPYAVFMMIRLDWMIRIGAMIVGSLGCNKRSNPPRFPMFRKNKRNKQPQQVKCFMMM